MRQLKSREEFERLVGSGYFTVVFTKKDGSERTLNGRLGVHKYVKGTDKRTHLPEDLVIVYDQTKEAYRSFHLDSLKEIRAGGKTYHIEGGTGGSA